MFTQKSKEEIEAYVKAQNERDAQPVKPGEILYNSWGYDMTINDFCKVLGNTGKTLKCVMLAKNVKNDDGLGNGRATPDQMKETGKPFRLRITPKKDSPGFWYCGSYPYVIGQDGEARDTHRGTFFRYDGKGNYENTWD